MGQINFEFWKNKQASASKKQSTATTQQNGDKPYVGYFTLKNDKDTAIVRIMHDSPEDFDMVVGHRITINDKLRLVSCLNEKAGDDKCPLCAAGKKTEDKIYIHLIEYTKDANGQIVATPKVWERSAYYANTLINNINNYGPLSDCIFKITRNGVAGSKKTTYDLMYANPNVYTNEMYPKKTELFEGYKAVGTVVWTMDAKRMEALLNGGESQEEVATPKAVPQYETPAPRSYEPTPAAATVTPTPAPIPPMTPQTPNFSTPDNGVARPTRRYYQ